MSDSSNQSNRRELKLESPHIEDDAWYWVRFDGLDGWTDWTPAKRQGNHWNSVSFRGIPMREVEVGRKLVHSTDVETSTTMSLMELSELPAQSGATNEDAELLARVIEQFEDDGETDVDDKTLMRFAAMGLLKCTRFEVTSKGAEIATLPFNRNESTVGQKEVPKMTEAERLQMLVDKSREAQEATRIIQAYVDQNPNARILKELGK